MATITVKELNQAIADICEKFFDGVASDSEKAVAEVAAETVTELQSTSPKDTGKYARGWKVRQNAKQKYNSEVEVYNTKYQLTHLLEHGHVKVVHGHVLGFTAARPHIAKAEQHANEKLENKIIKVVQSQ